MLIKKEEFYYDSLDGITKIHAVRWLPEKGKEKGVLQIIHGMCEYIDRYDEFARYLAEKGFIVVGHDHLGHGKSVTSEEKLGYFSDHNPNKILLQDIHTLHELTLQENPDLPYFMMGHSMGSFLFRQYMLYFGDVRGMIVIGTGNKPKLLMKAGKILCKIIGYIKGFDCRSELIYRMAFGGYNSRFKKEENPAAWLTKERKITEAYINDKHCNFKFTVNAYNAMFTSILDAEDENKLNKIPKDLPIVFLSGADDPVGGYGKDVQKLYQIYHKHGLKNARIRLYPNDRHEILNETDRKQVYCDILRWLEHHRKTC